MCLLDGVLGEVENVTQHNAKTMSKKKPGKRELRKSELAEKRQARLSAALEQDPNLREELALKWTPLVGPKLARAKRESAWVCL
jgi:hypothetical protein